MRIEILDRAAIDLTDGFNFYETQQAGLGDYFLNSLYSDIESLQLYAEFTARLTRIIIGCCQNVFLSRFSTR